MNTHNKQIETEKKHRASRRMLARLGMVAALTAGVLTGATPLAQTGTTTAAPTAMPTTKPVAAKSENAIISEGLDNEGGIKLMVNKTIVLKTRVPYKRVSLGTAEVADINTIGPQSILLTAKKAGTTQLIIWDDDDRSQVIDVLVVLDLAALQDQIKTMFPGSNIEVSSVNGAVALRGRVSDLRIADQIVAIAKPYSSVGNNATSVLNFLEISGGQQVMLKVRFAEVSRSAVNNLGINLGYTDGRSYGATNAGNVSNFGIIPATDTAADSLGVNDPAAAATAFGKAVTGSTAIYGMINALRENGLLRTLAEPDLVAISGQEANFLAGGEIPIPVSQGSSGGTSITIEYKKFGVLLKFVPVVLGNGNIRLRCAPEVSELDFANAITLNGFRVPALTNRSVETTVEMHEGQTLAIGGLLTQRVSTTASSTPILGAIPVLGALFRSTRYERKETELVVMVTPVIVAGMNPAQVGPVPGEKWRDPSMASLFLMRDLGEDKTELKADDMKIDSAPATASPAATDSDKKSTAAVVAPAAAAAAAPTAAATAAPAAKPEPSPTYQGSYGFAPAASTTTKPTGASATTTKPAAKP